MQRSPEAVMLFAAGFGTRMRELTRDKPKPMIEVAGQPLIAHALNLAQEINPSRIAANVHYKPEPLKAFLEPENVLVSHEIPEILDTGGGLRLALPLLGAGPVFTMNTDAIWKGPNPLKAAQEPGTRTPWTGYWSACRWNVLWAVLAAATSQRTPKAASAAVEIWSMAGCRS